MEPVGVYLTLKGFMGLIGLVTSAGVGSYIGLQAGVRLLDKIEHIKERKVAIREATVTSEK